MSGIREARRTLPAIQQGGSAARSRRCRWGAIAGALAAGTLWFALDAVPALKYRGALFAPVKRSDLFTSILCQGTLESASNLDIKSRVRGRRNILEMLPDGSYVRKGDLLLRLDSTSLEEAIAAEQMALTKAEAAVTRAKKTWEAAKIAVDEYGEGKYVQRRLELTQDIMEAQRKLTSVERKLLQVQIMFRRGFISPPHVEAMELAVEKAQSDLAKAQVNRNVLEDFTRPKKLAELASKRDAAAAQLKAEEIVVWRQTTRIKGLQDDLNRCVIQAPRDGMVIYASETAGRQGSKNQKPSQIYPGATVRQHQALVHLADPSKMRVKVVVPQSELRQLRRGQRAHARVLDEELPGEIVSIAERPDPAASEGSTVKRHAVVIALGDHSERLKPGMNADVEILLQQKRDALVIPVLCVVDDRGKPCVRVKKRRGVALRQVMLGMANDALVEVVDGVKEGELVLLSRPR